MLLQDKTIAIIGGGPGGLTLARLLQLKGVRVKVYERDVNKDARVQGSPLDMHHDSGMAAIRAASLLDEFKTYYRPGADRMLITDEQAKVHFSDHEDVKHPDDFDSPYFRPEIDRAPLRNMFLESLQPETVVWDSHFISMEKQGQGWWLHFKSGSSVYADIVIGSDGANSKIRPYLTTIPAFYSGVTMLEGNVYNARKAAPRISRLIKDGKIMAFGHKKNLLLGQKGDGNLGFYASLKVDENWSATNGVDYADKTQVLAWFKREYVEWGDIWDELFERAATPFIPRRIYCMPLDQDWESHRNLTIIGDAAHVMPPFAGEGANMAMLDALELSNCLTGNTYKTLQEAISFYETAMRQRAAAAAKESLENGERMHSEHALQTMVSFFNQPM